MKKIYLLVVSLFVFVSNLVAETESLYVLYDYLKVFPQDLGRYTSAPYDIINQINNSKQYGYGTWRIPTQTELNLMKAEGIIDNTEAYMSTNNSKGLVRLVTDQNFLSAAAEGAYEDLDLKSKTTWRDRPEYSRYSHEMACKTYKTHLPSKKQFDELVENCNWEKENGGYIVTGKNGNAIFVENGIYWSITYSRSYHYYCLYVSSSGIGIRDMHYTQKAFCLLINNK